MTRAELEHAIRAACDVSGDNEVYVFGSQAILGQYPDAPESLRQSAEAEAHDLAASKLVAFRDKDRDFVRTLIVEKLIAPAKLCRRLDQLSNNPRVTPELLAVIQAWVGGVLKDMSSWA